MTDNQTETQERRLKIAIAAGEHGTTCTHVANGSQNRLAFLTCGHRIFSITGDGSEVFARRKFSPAKTTNLHVIY
jgi:hypothetical protein